MGARPDVDAILAGYNWSIQNGIDHPEYVGQVCACAGAVADERDAASHLRASHYLQGGRRRRE